MKSDSDMKQTQPSFLAFENWTGLLGIYFLFPKRAVGNVPAKMTANNFVTMPK